MLITLLSLLGLCTAFTPIRGYHAVHERLPYLEVELSVHLHRQLDCLEETCDIAYKVALLDDQSGLFDMTPVDVFDGRMKMSIDVHHYNDIAIFNITPHMVRLVQQGEHLRLGVRLFGLNANIQDYFLVDYTRAMLSYVKEAAQWIKSDDIGLKTVARRGRMAHLESLNGCACEGYECYCCEHLDIKQIHVNDTVCFNITYLPSEYGIAITFDIDGRVYYEEKFSAKNPPPICFGIPDLKEFASICIRLTNLTVKHEEFDGCVYLIAELVHVHVAQVKLGCFHLGPIVRPLLGNDDLLIIDDKALRHTTPRTIAPVQIDLF